MKTWIKKSIVTMSVLFASFIVPFSMPVYTNATDTEEVSEAVSTEKYFFEDVINADTNKGFPKDNTNPLDKKDCHFAWKLGSFSISGFTRQTKDDSQNLVFLKNVGDEVTLSFHLNHDINKLNGNDKLVINEDKDGYDALFGVPETNFGRGALIIRYTDYQNKKGEPTIYTNYLEGVEKGADTVVELCEEGDYEVSLDYSVLQKTFGDLGGLQTSKLAAFSHDYCIYFKFSVRNGNCMVYPFDVSTKQELTNTAFTENGFSLDLARSRYLDIDIEKQNLNEGSNDLAKDTRFNKPARDGESFTDEGIYIIKVKNRYTKSETEKTLYVGTNDLLRAYVTNTGYTIPKLNEMIKLGYVVNEDGTLTDPKSTPAENNESSKTPVPTPTEPETPKKKSAAPVIIVILLLLAGGGGAGAFIFLKKKNQ